MIEHLKKEHTQLREALKTFRGDPQGNIDNLAELIKVHTLQEEAILYTEARMHNEEMTDHAIEEHNKVDATLKALIEDPSDKDVFDELKDDLIHHMREEEDEFFPFIKETFTKERLEEMKAQAIEIKERA